MIKHADVWLLRHGAAVTPDAKVSDAEDYARALTQQGIVEAVNAGDLLAKLTHVDKVHTSPRVRCVQTAALACGLKFKRDHALDHGKPRAALDVVKDGRVSVVVGHHVLADGIEKATGRRVTLEIGGLAHLAVRDGQWKLRQLLTPADIARLT